MEVGVTEHNLVKLTKVFNPIIIETPEGNQFSICMRDEGIEIGTLRKYDRHSNFYIIDADGISAINPCSFNNMSTNARKGEV